MKQKSCTFYNSSAFELKNLICGMGESKIEKYTIFIKHYPFLPSVAYNKNTIDKVEIDAIC